MSWHVWTLFLGFTFLVSATPGPNMLLVMSTSVRHGVRASLATMAGCMSALLCMMSLSAAGLGALLLASPAVFDVLRWTGAAYLAWLGWRSWRAPVVSSSAESGSLAPALPGAPAPDRPASLYRQGLLVAFSNPKAILFAAALFPQFIAPERPVMLQFVVLLATFAVVETAWYLVYAAMGQRLSAWLRRAAVMRAFNRLTGGIFVGFAAWLAAARA